MRTSRSSYSIPALAGAAALVLLFATLFSAQGAAGNERPPLRERGLVGASAADARPVLVIRYREGASPTAIAALEAAFGIASRHAFERSGLVTVEPADPARIQQLLHRLSNSAIVAEAGIEQVMTVLEVPDDPFYSHQWHLRNGSGGIRAEAAWDLAQNRGAGVVVAVIDTGVAFEAHTRPGPLSGNATFAPAPDLAGVPIVAPWSFIDDSPHAGDDHGHGTHVAGTIVQATDNGVGVAGVAPGASLMPLKVLDWSGQGQASDLVEAIYYATDNGADIISMSLGFSGSGTPDEFGNVCTEIIGLAGALEYANANGVTVVAATGNDGGTTVSCPAAYPTVIAVGATRYDEQVTFYSNRGAAIDVVAPGGDPNVDQNGDGFSDGVLQQTFCFDTITLLLTNDYTQFCEVFQQGTSMAAPHVSGIAALLLGENSTLSPAQVRHYLETTARDLAASGWDSESGWGLVDAAAAVAALQGGPPPVFTPTPTPSVSPTAIPTSTPTPTPIPGPNAPSNLVAELSNVVNIKLTWSDNSSDEQYFYVERSVDQGLAWAQAAIVIANTTTWTNYSLAADTEYWYRVKATRDGISSSYSNVVAQVTGSAPADPSDLAATNIHDTKLTLTWADNADNEQYYRVERSLDGASFSQVAVLTANSTSWTALSLSPGTTYHFRVRASVGTLYSGYSPVLSVTTASEPIPPAAPSNLAAEALSATSIRLSWTDNATDEQYYRVERSLDGASFAEVALLSAGTTTWTNSGLAPSTAHTYRVRASRGTIYSTYSNAAMATTDSGPIAPSNLQATALSASSIALTWSDNASDEQYYHIERSIDGLNFAQVGLVTANSTSWTNSSLTPDTTYYYRVKASKSGVPSLYSNVAIATTLPPPAAPTGLVATAAGPDRITLTWVDNATDEQYYRIERSTDGLSFVYAGLVGANSTTWTNTSLAASTTYHYRVRAQAGTIYSEYSNVASATTDAPPAAPSNVVVTLVTATALRVSWNDNAVNEQYYRIERSTDGVNFTQVSIVLANTTSWTNYSLAAGTTYHYRVRASVGTVYSDYSEVASGTTP